MNSRKFQIIRRRIITFMDFGRRERVFRKFDDTFASRIPESTRAHGDVSSLLWISSQEGVFSANLMIFLPCGFQELPGYEATYHRLSGIRAEKECFPQI